MTCKSLFQDSVWRCLGATYVVRSHILLTDGMGTAWDREWQCTGQNTPPPRVLFRHLPLPLSTSLRTGTGNTGKNRTVRSAIPALCRAWGLLTPRAPWIFLFIFLLPFHWFHLVKILGSSILEPHGSNRRAGVLAAGFLTPLRINMPVEIRISLAPS